MIITVFTPTYDRGYCLGILYQSLCDQTFRDFEWVIVDDGSKDNTKELVYKWMLEGRIPIHYLYKENGGKHRAINVGLQNASGELFFIVDSDDYLPERSLETIHNYYLQVKDNDLFCGVCGLKCYPDGKPTTGYFPSDVVDWYFINRKYAGDTAVVFKTEIAKQYSFPDYPGEKFCAESLMYNRIGSKYLLRYFNENVYVCEYLPDGLSASSVKNRRNSPTYATQIYFELMRMSVNWKKKIKSAINFWRFFIYVPNLKHLFIRGLPLWSFLFSPFGLIMSIKDTIYLRGNSNNRNKA